MKNLIISAIIATAGLTASAASATQYWVQEGIHLNARSGPSTYYHAVGKFNGCTPLHVVAYKDGWAKVSYKHNYYWVSAKYLQKHDCHKKTYGHKQAYKHNSHKKYGY